MSRADRERTRHNLATVPIIQPRSSLVGRVRNPSGTWPLKHGRPRTHPAKRSAGSGSRRPHSLSLINRSINSSLQQKPRKHAAVESGRPRPADSSGRQGPSAARLQQVRRPCSFSLDHLGLSNHTGNTSLIAVGRVAHPAVVAGTGSVVGAPPAGPTSLAWSPRFPMGFR